MIEWVKKRWSGLWRIVAQAYNSTKTVFKRKSTREYDNKYEFQKLTPNDGVELNVYKDAFDYIFSNSDIYNVAISGAYGAGKSSVIASYKKSRSDLRFVHVSLAHFETSEGEEEKEVKESILEGKILNQLIHQIPSDKIPQTNFKVKRKVGIRNFLVITISTMLLFLALLHIFLFEQWNGYVSSLPMSELKKMLNLSTNSYVLLVSGALCIIVTSIFIYKIVKLQMNKNMFRKISLQGNEIEIFEESNESYFDKYLNEVLYLFENVKADVIVFEDMDRFNVSRIFERLREINTLANIQLQKERKQPLRFFYLLRDDIFISKDRTKFFEYIVPVVPVVDSSNSYDQFISHFKKGGIYELFDESFLQGLSLYIDDMRLLKNIYNEFIIYYKRLNTTDLNCNKMLAMIAYKNLFPRDFSDLQLNQGMVFALFAQKETFVKQEIERLSGLVAPKEAEISRAKNEHLIFKEELDLVYQSKRTQINQSYYHPEREKELKKLEKEVAARQNSIDITENNRLSELEDELSDIKEEIIYTNNKQLNEIITRENIDAIFKITTTNEIGDKTNFHEIKRSDYFDLLKYLIRNGYIDETYPDYMTYFYEHSLTRVDKKFLRSITDKMAKEHTYQLKNPKLVVARLREVDFDQEEILNFDLLQYLLQTPKHEIYLNRFLQQLKKTRNFKFIGEYFDTAREIEAFIKCLNQQWPEMFQSVVERKKMTESQTRLYSIYTLYYSSVDEIKAVNSEECLTDYISSSVDYLDIYDPVVDKLIHGLIELNVSFIGITKANTELLIEIYNNSLYRINFDNLSLMLKTFYDIEDENDLYHRNYTLVRSNPESPLAQYAHENTCAYIDEVLANSNGVIKDDENVVLIILNNETVSTDQKRKYIDLLQTLITLIDDVDDTSLWNVLLSKRLVKYSEENILLYFGTSESLDNVLISFINGNDSHLDFSQAKKDFGDEKSEEFFDTAIVCNQLSTHKYRETLSSLEFSYEIFEVEGISNEKFRVFVDENIISMNLETLQFVREHYPSESVYFIRKNIDVYADIMTSEEVEIDEIVELLAWDITDDLKTRLLGFTNEPISILNKRYSTSIVEHILRNNFDFSDLSSLLVTYENWANEIQQIIYELAKENIAHIIINSMQICDKLLEALIESDDLEDSQKTDLFIFSLHRMKEEACRRYLEMLGLDEYKKIFENRTRPKYEINEKNAKLLTAFKKKGWIFDFQEDYERKGNYKILRNKSVLKPV
ncbi:hypothetical protein [Paenibacillus sp. NPDC057967]|uniref:YobI family P-loop NTPase n=1 Tax=Paenibacillus sp. NPDC057967 TaxID=3346293 RepID=UPI0036DF75D4